VGLEALEEFGKAVTQQTNAIAAKTMKHPSGRRRKDGQYAATTTTLLYFGTGVTRPNGHIFCWYLYCPPTPPESWDFSTKLAQLSQYVRETPAILPRN
jgi:hypothetical protein